MKDSAHSKSASFIWKLIDIVKTRLESLTLCVAPLGRDSDEAFASLMGVESSAGY